MCHNLQNATSLSTPNTKNKRPPKSNQIKSSLYSPYYAEACNELRGPSPRLSAWATQLRRNVATVASRWRHCVDLTGPGVETPTSRTDSVRFATELTAGFFSKNHLISQNCKTYIHKIKQYLILMLPILSSSMIIYHLRDTLLNINYLSFLKPLK